jgi:ATP-dependent protease ClpP protease subunit
MKPIVVTNMDGGAIISVHDDVGLHQSVNEVLHAIGDEQNVKLLFNSGGGDCLTTFPLFAALKDRNTTAIVERCCSASTILLCAAKHVSLLPDAVIMTHAPRAAVYGTVEKLRTGADDLEKCGWMMHKAFFHRTGRDFSHWLNGEDHYWTTGEALAIGLADEIIEQTPGPAVLPDVAQPSIDPEARFLLDVVRAAGPVRTRDKVRLFRELSAWFSQNISELPMPEGGCGSVVPPAPPA